jgi:hypothetical protein
MYARRTALLVLVLLVGVLTGCSAPAFRSGGTPSPAAQIDQAGGRLPEPKCPDAPVAWAVSRDGLRVPIEVALTCEDAVAAALDRINVARDELAGSGFFYGDYCPPGAFCAFAGLDHGYVVFSTFRRGPQPWFSVPVRLDDRGTVLAGPARAFPPMPLDAVTRDGHAFLAE